MCTLHLFVLVGYFSCILQSPDAAPTNEKLPFEVDVNSGTDSGNVGLYKQASTGNKLTAQASKQGENFVASPKPVNPQGFSLNAQPETMSATGASNKPTAAAVATAGPWSMMPNFLFGRSPNFFNLMDFNPFTKMNPFGSGFHAAEPSPLSETLSDVSGFDFPMGNSRFFEPNFGALSDYGFQMAPIPLPVMPPLKDMELVEDHNLDDEHSKGNFRTYKSKDGNALVQIMHRHGRLVGNPRTNAGKSRSSRGRRNTRRLSNYLRNNF